MKMIIKKLLAWVLKDDLRKLRNTIVRIETDGQQTARELDRRVRQDIEDHLSQLKQSLAEGHAVLRKWGSSEELLKAHRRTTNKLERAWKKHPSLLGPGTPGWEEEAVLRSEIETLAVIYPEPEATELRRAAQSWVIDFENPCV